jgi:hypothetical protein
MNADHYVTPASGRRSKSSLTAREVDNEESTLLELVETKGWSLDILQCYRARTYLQVF